MTRPRTAVTAVDFEDVMAVHVRLRVPAAEVQPELAEEGQRKPGAQCADHVRTGSGTGTRRTSAPHSE
jgi:hypothetical protein